MKIRKFIVILTIVFAVGLLLIIYLYKVSKPIQFLEATEHTRSQLKGYLNGYYKTNGCYPPKLDVSVLRVYRTESYRDALKKIEYKSDGNSFRISWRYPHPWLDSNEFMILTLEGQKGKIINDERCPEDSWIALRISNENERGMAGFLVPLAVDRNEPDWVFRHGIFYCDIWDMEKIADTIIGDKMIITKGAFSFLKQNQDIFEEYEDSIEKILYYSLKGSEYEHQSLLKEKAHYKEGASFSKIRGQTSTRAGFLINDGLVDEMKKRSATWGSSSEFKYAVYVPEIDVLYKYLPNEEITLKCARFMTTPISGNKLMEWEKLEGWTDEELQLIKNNLEEHKAKATVIVYPP